MWKGIIGRAFTQVEFKEYCQSLQPIWKPVMIVLHNTGVPNLAQRPDGLNYTHIKNLENYYRNIQKWSGGPHLFVDDKKIWVFTPLVSPGVHSPSYNPFSYGVEMLGDYEIDSFIEGRGKLVHDNTIAALATLCQLANISPEKIILHKEDPKTTHNCPGKHVDKWTVINEVKLLLQNELPA